VIEQFSITLLKHLYSRCSLGDIYVNREYGRYLHFLRVRIEFLSQTHTPMACLCLVFVHNEEYTNEGDRRITCEVFIRRV